MNGLNRTIRISVLLSTIATFALLNCGCRNFEVNDEPTPGIVLPKTKMESDSVAMRVAVAEFDDLQKSAFQSFVDVTDQKLPFETRRRLDEHGLRVSVISNVNSQRLQQLLSPRVLKRQWLTDNERELKAAGKLEPVLRLASQRHVEKNRAEPFSVEISPVRERLTWTVYSANGPVSDGAELAQCGMRVTSWPQPNGSVKLQFLPEVHHGQELSQIGVEGQDLAVTQRRMVKELRPLAFEVELKPGETVMVSPTATLDRIGGMFFQADDQQAVQPTDPIVAANSQAIQASEFFPMLDEQDDSPQLLLAAEDLNSIEPTSSTANQRPRPWQRVLLVRVVEVTPATIP